MVDSVWTKNKYLHRKLCRDRWVLDRLVKPKLNDITRYQSWDRTEPLEPILENRGEFLVEGDVIPTPERIIRQYLPGLRAWDFGEIGTLPILHPAKVLEGFLRPNEIGRIRLLMSDRQFFVLFIIFVNSQTLKPRGEKLRKVYRNSLGQYFGGLTVFGILFYFAVVRWVN